MPKACCVCPSHMIYVQDLKIRWTSLCVRIFSKRKKKFGVPSACSLQEAAVKPKGSRWARDLEATISEPNSIYQHIHVRRFKSHD